MCLAGWRPFRERTEGLIDELWPGARTSGIARTRLIDDMLRESQIKDRIERVVLLGAGFDTRAHRLRCLSSLEVIEVDHPSTLGVKRDRIRRRSGVVSASPIYVGVDFDRDSLGDAWAKAGLDRSRPTFFVWEGVTNYLSAEAVDAVLDFVHSTAPGNKLLFTYVDRRAIDEAAPYRGSRLLRWTLRRSGEPWTFGIDPAQLPAFLRERGFELLSDADSLEFRTRYLADRQRNPTGYEFYHAALARVT